MKIPLLVLILCGTACDVIAGTQQDFFKATVATADRVVVLRVDPPKKRDTPAVHVAVIDSRDPLVISRVTGAIEMNDPQPKERNGDEEVWTSSVLTFGVADYILRFFAGEKMILEYGTDTEIGFLAPFGAAAKQPVDLWVDFPLSEESSKRLRAIMRDAEKGPTRRYRQPR
jgi:hypothetical protein